MKSTITAVLTNKDARSYSTVKAKVAKELSAGIPWWDRAA